MARSTGNRCAVSFCGLLTVATQASAQTSNYFELLSRLPVGIPELQSQLDQVFEDVVERLGVSLVEKVNVAFESPSTEPCRSRGAAMARPRGPDGSSSPPLILIFADETTTSDQIRGVFAHEVGHVLQALVLDEDQSIASIFIEGFASWAAGRYWLAWHGATSFQSAVKSYIAAGTYIPLHENDGFLDTLGEGGASRFGADCLNQRDLIYTEWAAFIDYLVEEHGRETLYSLFEVPPLLSDESEGGFKKPNFPAVYGSSLEQLEATWLASLAID